MFIICPRKLIILPPIAPSIGRWLVGGKKARREANSLGAVPTSAAATTTTTTVVHLPPEVTI